MKKTRFDPNGELSLRVVAAEEFGNRASDVFRDWIMSLMDMAAGIMAGARAKGRVVTAAVSNIDVGQPARTGDVVCVYTRIIRTGRTSITVGVEAYALRNYLEERVRLTAADYVVVAVDEDGLPRPLPFAA